MAASNNNNNQPKLDLQNLVRRVAQEPIQYSDIELAALPALIKTGHIHYELASNNSVAQFPLQPVTATKAEFDEKYHPNENGDDDYGDNDGDDKTKEAKLCERNNKLRQQLLGEPEKSLQPAHAPGRLSQEVVDAMELLRSDLVYKVGADVITGTVFAHQQQQNQMEGRGSSIDPDNAMASFTFSVPCLPYSSTAANDNDDGSQDRSSQVFTVPLDKYSAEQLYWLGTECPFGHEDKGTVVDPNVRCSREFDAVREITNLPPFLRNPRDHFPELRQVIMEQLCPQEPEQIATQPYKLVCYREGDFFKAHTDSVQDPRHFGILAIHLPMIGDLVSTEVLDEPDDYLYYDGNEQDFGNRENDNYHRSMLHGESSCSSYTWNDLRYDRRSRFHFSNVARADYEKLESQKLRCPNNEHLPEREPAKENENIGDAEFRAQSGRLRFYLGRYVEDEDSLVCNYDGESAVVNSNCRGTYDRPSLCANQMVASVMLQNYSFDEVYGGVQLIGHGVSGSQQTSAAKAGNVSANRSSFQTENYDDELDRETCSKKLHFANSIAAGFAPNIKNVQVFQQEAEKINRDRQLELYEADAAKRQNRPAERKYLPMHFAAWNTQILHDVEPLGNNSYRFVMLYKLYRKNQSVTLAKIPRPSLTIANHLTHLAKVLAAASAKAAARPVNANKPTDLGFGILLRNRYPLECLKSWENLKGADLIAHRLISLHFECFLVPVVYDRTTTPSHPFCQQRRLNHVAICGHPPRKYNLQELQKNFNFDNSYGLELVNEKIFEEVVFSRAPQLRNLVWLELGLGTLSCAGSVYANIDCGFEWHLKSAALVCTLRKSDWVRRRILFLIAENGFLGKKDCAKISVDEVAPEAQLLQQQQQEARRRELNYIRKFYFELYPVFRNIAYFL